MNTIAGSMTPSVNFQQCTYLHAASFPHAFASQRAELGYITEQITSLDHHISQLNTLRQVLHCRSRQLHNLLSPIYALPMEVLSSIFQQLIYLGPHTDAGFFCYRERLGRALVLRSVSSLFRHVAFRTPELWKGVSLRVGYRQAIGRALSLLRHCIALAPHVNLSISESLNEEGARSAIDIIFAPDVTQKIKTFELYDSTHASNLWIEKLKGASFPMLDSLVITLIKMDLSLDLSTLKSLTRLSTYDRCLKHPIIVPPSLQHLDIRHVSQRMLCSLLYQCPNLLECVVDIDSELIDDWESDTRYTEPPTLNHLKELNFRVPDTVEASSLVQSLRLPSLETLRLLQNPQSEFGCVFPLCRIVSQTLTTLIINTFSGESNYDNWYQLSRLPFPQLRTLEIWTWNLEPFLSAIRVLELLEDESSNPETRHLPALRSVFLDYGGDIEPRYLLDSLKEWRIGEVFYYQIRLSYYRSSGYRRGWSQELEEELKSIVCRRRIEVIWHEIL